MYRSALDCRFNAEHLRCTFLVDSVVPWHCCCCFWSHLGLFTQAAHCSRHNHQCGPESQSLVTSTALYTPIESTWLLASTQILKMHYHSQFALHHTAVIMFTKRSLDAAMTNHVKCVHPWQLFVASCVVIINTDYCIDHTDMHTPNWWWEQSLDICYTTT